MIIKKETKNIIFNINWMVFDKLFILLINLLVVVKIANHYGPMEYGSYEYVVNIVAVFEILVMFVDGRVVKKQYDGSNFELVVYSATICRILFSVVAAIIGIIFISIGDGSAQFKIMFAMLLFNAIVVNMRFGMANRFEFLLQSKIVVIASNISILFGGILQLLAVYFDMSIIVLTIISLANSTVNLFIIYIQYNRMFVSTKRIKKLSYSLIKDMIIESLPLAIASACATIYTRCDSIMLGSMMTTEEVAIYAISVKLISCVLIAKVPIQESIFPTLSNLYKTNKKEYERIYIKYTCALSWICIVGNIIAFIILPFIFNMLNEEYMNAMNVFKIQAIGSFFMYNAALRAGHYTLINRGKILMWSQLVSVILNIVLNYIGIRLYGIYGAALATVITQAISLMLSNLFFDGEGREVFMWQIQAINPIWIFK